jgi:hypothetical protein
MCISKLHNGLFILLQFPFLTYTRSLVHVASSPIQLHVYLHSSNDNPLLTHMRRFLCNILSASLGLGCIESCIAASFAQHFYQNFQILTDD